MSRRSAARVTIDGLLTVETPIHVGGVGGDIDSDMSLAVDGLGRLYAPGTSLAGAFRSWMRRVTNAAEQALANRDTGAMLRLWGDAAGPGASRIVVEDALVFSSPAEAKDFVNRSDRLAVNQFVVAEIRDGVGIDRITGAAAHGILYSRAVIPAGCVIRLELWADAADDAALVEAKAHLGTLMSALESRSVRLGAGTTRGLGRVKLDRSNTTYREIRLDSKAGLLSHLRGDVAVEPIASLIALAANAPAQNPRVLRVEIDWTSVGPLMVRASVDGFAVDSVPLMSRTAPTALSLVLPGSSIKGALRSHAERIVRTVLGSPAADDREKWKERFLDQLDSLDLTRGVFGGAPVRPGKPARPAGTAHHGLAALRVDDCYGNIQLSDDEWIHLLGSEQAVPARADENDRERERAELDPTFREELRSRGLEQLTHVAIDRWTGGAAAGLLYSVLEARCDEWDAISLELDLRRLRGPEQWQAIALLIILMKELKRGLIPLGHGVNRGMGDIAANSIRFFGLPNVPGLGGEAALADGIALDDLPPEWVQRLAEDHWQPWIDTNKSPAPTAGAPS